LAGDNFDFPGSEESGTGTITASSGTISGNAPAVSDFGISCPAYPIRGSYTNSSISANWGPVTCTGEGITWNASGTMNLSRVQ
jgi:hypothetical protein